EHRGRNLAVRVALPAPRPERDRSPGTRMITEAAGSGDHAASGVESADVDQVDDEDQGLARLDDGARAACAVAQVGRDDEPTAAADLHADDTAVPAGDDVAGTEREREG